MKHQVHARKRRQFKYLSKQLRRLAANSWKGVSERKKTKMLEKIRQLMQELRGILPQFEMKKALGTAALLVGLAVSPMQAQVFDAPIVNPFGLDSLENLAFPAFADMDNDGDMDLFVGDYSYYGPTLVYFENTGTADAPVFGKSLENPFGFSSDNDFSIPTLADLDNDGDMDLLVAEAYGDLQYFENVGIAQVPGFAAPVTNPFGLSTTSYIALPTFVDMDNDGDMDLVLGEYYGNFQYFENTGTPEAPAFAAPVQNPFGLTQVPDTYISAPAFADLDHDGDMDLLAGEYYGAFQYFENTGTAEAPAFAAPVENPFGLTNGYYYVFPAFADLDNDGDMDLLAGEYYGALQYYQNNDPTIGILTPKEDFDLRVFPNIASDQVHIQSAETISRVELLSLTGRQVASYGNRDSVPVGDLPNGQYYLRATTEEGKVAVRKITKVE